MQVQVNTSNGIENKESLERWAGDYLAGALARFAADVSRVEIQLSAETPAGRKGTANKRCTLEARLVNGHPPLAATSHADTQDLAFRGATEKLAHLLDHTLGKLDRHHDRKTIRRDTDVTPS